VLRDLSLVGAPREISYPRSVWLTSKLSSLDDDDDDDDDGYDTDTKFVGGNGDDSSGGGDDDRHWKDAYRLLAAAADYGFGGVGDGGGGLKRRERQAQSSHNAATTTTTAASTTASATAVHQGEGDEAQAPRAAPSEYQVHDDDNDANDDNSNGQQPPDELARRNRCRMAKRIVEADRLEWSIEQGYYVRMVELPSIGTTYPKRELLLGAREGTAAAGRIARL